MGEQHRNITDVLDETASPKALQRERLVRVLYLTDMNQLTKSLAAHCTSHSNRRFEAKVARVAEGCQNTN